MDGAATHCLTSRPLHRSSAETTPTQAAAQHRRRLPRGVGHGVFRAGPARRRRGNSARRRALRAGDARRELLAALLVHGASTGLVALPLAVCGLHGYHREDRRAPPVRDASGVNAPAAPGLSFYPFLVESFLAEERRGHARGRAARHDVVFRLVLCPLVARDGRGQGRRDAAARALRLAAPRGLGGACWSSRCTRGLRRSSASPPATLAASMAFRSHSTRRPGRRLPPAAGSGRAGDHGRARVAGAAGLAEALPAGDAVEAYLGLEVVRDAPAPRRCVDAAALQRRAGRGGYKEAITRSDGAAPTAEIRRRCGIVSHAATTRHASAAASAKNEASATRCGEGEACLAGSIRTASCPSARRWPRYGGPAHVVCTDVGHARHPLDAGPRPAAWRARRRREATGCRRGAARRSRSCRAARPSSSRRRPTKAGAHLSGPPRLS